MLSHLMIAKFNGKCANCSKPIKAQITQIRYDPQQKAAFCVNCEPSISSVPFIYKTSLPPCKPVTGHYCIPLAAAGKVLIYLVDRYNPSLSTSIDAKKLPYEMEIQFRPSTGSWKPIGLYTGEKALLYVSWRGNENVVTAVGKLTHGDNWLSYAMLYNSVTNACWLCDKPQGLAPIADGLCITCLWVFEKYRKSQQRWIL